MVREALLTPEQLARATADLAAAGGIGSVALFAVKAGAVSEVALLRSLSKAHNMPAVDLLKVEPDDKVLAVPMHDPIHDEVHDLGDLPSHFLREVEHFFKIYKDLEGKRVEIIGWYDAEEARRIIVESIDRYNAKYGVGAAGV